MATGIKQGDKTILVPSKADIQSQIDTSKAGLETDVTALKTDNTNNKNRIGVLETDNTSNKSRIGVLETAKAQDQTTITNLQSNKLDKIWSTDIIPQTVTFLTDLLVLNRGSEVYKATLGDLLTHAINRELFVVVVTLPSTGESNKIYLLSKVDEESNNGFDEYIWVNNKWEILGNLKISLENYYTITQVDALLSGKANVSSVYTKAETDAKLLAQKVEVVEGVEW